MYAKDISTKIKSTLHTKAKRGEYLGALDPYGYLRHPDDKHKLIINEETAPVVRRMFEMRAAGMGSKSIATTLNNEGILSPKEYTRFRKHNPERDGEFERRHFWTRTYVQFMLKNEIYVGSMVQGRQYTPSYRSKKREPLPKEDWVVVPAAIEGGNFVRLLNIISAPFVGGQSANTGLLEAIIVASRSFFNIFFCFFLFHKAQNLVGQAPFSVITSRKAVERLAGFYRHFLFWHFLI